MTDDVRYPAMREQVLAALEHLSDPVYQQRVWLEGRPPPAGQPLHDFDLAFHILFDDLDLGGGSEDAVGDLFRTTEEAQAVDRVIEALEAVFSAAGGTEAPIEALLQTQAWPRVIATSRAALTALSSTGD